jgi:hypothetical protein
MKQEPVLLLVLVACLTEAGGALTLLAADHTTARSCSSPPARS